MEGDDCPDNQGNQGNDVMGQAGIRAMLSYVVGSRWYVVGKQVVASR